MADPMRIRAQMAGDKATVRVLMNHEMETGLRKDSAGKPIPAWYIQEVTAQHNGKPVMSAQWGASVSKNRIRRRALTPLKEPVVGMSKGARAALNSAQKAWT